MKGTLVLLFISAIFGVINNAYVGQNSAQSILQNIFQQVEMNFEAVYRNINNEPRGISNATDTSAMTDNLAIGKRTTAGDERWKCNTDTTWRDLGTSVHPRFVKEVVCVQTSCIHGFFVCRPYYYQIHVMVMREGDDDDFDLTIPSELRNEWKHSLVNLAVGCECGRMK